MFANYLMMTCLGVLMTVIPMQLLDIVQFAVQLLTAVFCCFRKKAVDSVALSFDRISQKLTGLN